MQDHNPIDNLSSDSWGSGESSLLFRNDIDSEALTVIKFGFVSALQHTRFWRQGAESRVSRWHKYIGIFFMFFRNFFFFNLSTCNCNQGHAWVLSEPLLNFLYCSCRHKEVIQVAYLGESARESVYTFFHLPPAVTRQIPSRDILVIF